MTGLRTKVALVVTLALFLVGGSAFASAVLPSHPDPLTIFAGLGIVLAFLAFSGGHSSSGDRDRPVTRADINQQRAKEALTEKRRRDVNELIALRDSGTISDDQMQAHLRHVLAGPGAGNDRGGSER